MKNLKQDVVRILHIVTIMDRAGLETMIMNYYRNIDREKIQFDFLVHRDTVGQFDEEIISLGGKIYHISPFSLKTIAHYKNQLRSFFNEHKEYKIVHSHLDALSNFPLAVAKECNIPMRIAHSHTSYFDKDLKFIVRQVCKKSIHKYATHFFGCSEEAIKFMFGKKNHGVVVNNAIDISKFNYNHEIRGMIRNDLGIRDEFVVGNVGRFNAVKNQIFLLEIFCEIKKLISDTKLVLVGDGVELIRVKDKVNELGLTKDVLFLGVRSDVNDIIQSMDYFVLPSLYEGLGIVLIEAQATGLLCAASKDKVPSTAKVTDLLEFIPLESNPQEWALNIVDLYNKKHTRSSRTKEIIDNGYDVKYEARKLQKNYLDNYIDT